MPHLLIPDVPDSVIADVDAQASVLGISRSEYVRWHLVREMQRIQRRVTAADLRKSGGPLSGLLDKDLMRRAWR